MLAEFFCLLGRRPADLAAAWRFVRSGAVAVFPIGDDDLPALDALMSVTPNRPMDFADATLVHLAQRESIETVVTIDHDDFETYRAGRRRFRIEPGRQQR